MVQTPHSIGLVEGLSRHLCQRTTVFSFARIYLCLSVYPIRMDCLCIIDSLLFTFVYVNDERVYGSGFDRRGYGLLMVQRERTIELVEVGLFVGLRKGEKTKGVTMKRVAIYAGLFAVLASPFAALAATTAQSATKADSSTVTITGRVSCSRFGGATVTARKGMSVAQTIQYCANFQGADYTLVSGNKIYRLTGDKNVLAKMSGQTVTVAGRLNTDEPVPSYALMGTVEATSVAPAKN